MMKMSRLEKIKSGKRLAELFEDDIDWLIKVAEAAKFNMEWMEANVPEMECRNDEDCDHCEGTRVLEFLRKALAAEPKSCIYCKHYCKAYYCKNSKVVNMIETDWDESGVSFCTPDDFYCKDWEKLDD